MSRKGKPEIPIPPPSRIDEASRVNNLFMAALLWASRNNCNCKACERLKKVSELMEEGMEGV